MLNSLRKCFFLAETVFVVVYQEVQESFLRLWTSKSCFTQFSGTLFLLLKFPRHEWKSVLLPLSWLHNMLKCSYFPKHHRNQFWEGSCRRKCSLSQAPASSLKGIDLTCRSPLSSPEVLNVYGVLSLLGLIFIEYYKLEIHKRPINYSRGERQKAGKGNVF